MGCAANGAPMSRAAGQPAVSRAGCLIRVLAYRLQADAFGGLDKAIQRILRPDKDGNRAVPFDRRARRKRERASA